VTRTLRQWMMVIGLATLLIGCTHKAPDLPEPDALKSCDALEYEYHALLNRTSHEVLKQEEPTMGDRIVLGLGGVLSGVLPLVTSYFYIMPAATIWYYNTHFPADPNARFEQDRKERLERLTQILRQRCP